MKAKLFVPASLLCFIFFLSCGGQRGAFIPVPDESYFRSELSERIINPDNIIETKNGRTLEAMPAWLLAFINGGIGAVENLDAYTDKYVFIAVNQGGNFTILNKWAANYSAAYDFPMLAAARIEKRMIFTSSKYPDDEYGAFFETLVLNAYGGEYFGTVKEDTYWIRIKLDNENVQVYNFFILISIDRAVMQSIVSNMIAEALSSVTLTYAQASEVNRLRQTFFAGF